MTDASSPDAPAAVADRKAPEPPVEETAPIPKPATPSAKPPEGKAAEDDGADDSAKEAPSTVEAKVDPDAGEEKLFEDKAILYGFDSQGKDWKERGTGFMKILKNRQTARCRVLMRRAQTFRVCANHFILPGMTLKPSGDRALIWRAADFADGKETNDVLSVKFKSADIANRFKSAFEDGRAQNKALGAAGGQAAE
jgi:Ran-binding protein 1